MKRIKNKFLKALIVLGLMLIASGMMYFMVYFSAVPRVSEFFQHKKFWLIVNLGFVFSGVLILYAIIGRTWISIIVSSVISLVWAIADYYTVIYHGSPLFPNELANFDTAMDVAGGYSFAIDSDVIKIFLIFVVLIAVALLTRVLEKEEAEVFKAKRLKRSLISIVVGAVGIAAFAFCVLGPIKHETKDVMHWSWQNAVKKYGFWVCSLENANDIANPYRMPEGYSVEELAKITGGKPAESNECPDIIVILNETFYDLDRFYEVDPDVSLLEKFYSIDNAVYGYAPSGGGTNDTEYELLLSNSLYILNNTSPFNYVDLKDRFSAVQYAKGLGYTTAAMHCGDEANYHRNRAYREMDFDTIFLGEDDFKYQERNGKRVWLDSENYRDMLDYLNENPSEPHFVFLLTYQNHGGYNKNDSSLGTVRAGVDYGGLNEEINEYMSSLVLSSDAFYELTEELKDRRPTIVIMIGDHGPTIRNKLQPRETGFDADLAGSFVPYVIWTNYKEVPEKYGNLASVEALVPMAADIAGLPITPYYNKLLELHDVVPLRNVDGVYIDAPVLRGLRILRYFKRILLHGIQFAGGQKGDHKGTVLA